MDIKITIFQKVFNRYNIVVIVCSWIFIHLVDNVSRNHWLKYAFFFFINAIGVSIQFAVNSFPYYVNSKHLSAFCKLFVIFRKFLSRLASFHNECSKNLVDLFIERTECWLPLIIREFPHENIHHCTMQKLKNGVKSGQLWQIISPWVLLMRWCRWCSWCADVLLLH